MYRWIVYARGFKFSEGKEESREQAQWDARAQENDALMAGFDPDTVWHEIV